MKSYFKFLSRNKLYTIIEVFGLAIALMFILIIAKFSQTEFNIDKFHENVDNIYVLSNEQYIATAYGVSGKLLERYPEIRRTCAISDLRKQHVEVYDKGYDVETLAVDSTFFEMFSFELAAGERHQVLSTPNQVLVSESFVNNAFNGQSPLGKSITIQWGAGAAEYQISGVFKEIKNSIIHNYDLIVNTQLLETYINANISNKNCNNSAGVSLFIQTYPYTDLASKTDDMADYFKEFFWVYQRELFKEVILIPLGEVYFSDLRSASGEFNQGNKQFVFILSAVALFILFFALINYINLTVAQTGFRAKEMAMRRLLGSSKPKIMLRFISEAVLLTLIAFVISMMFTELVRPFTQSLLGREITLFQDITFGDVAFCIGMILIIGALAGIIPAVMISRYKPMDVVRGTFRLHSKMILGKAFVVVQNVITIIMLALTIALFMQFHHLLNKPLGYATKNIMNVQIPGAFFAGITDQKDMSPWLMLKSELEKIPDVKRVGFAQGCPIYGTYSSNIQRDGENIKMMFMKFDSTAFDILDFGIVKQNQENLTGYYWLTEEAARKLHVDQEVTNITINPEQNWDINVCGIIKDFNRISALYDGSQECNVIVMLDGMPQNLIIETTDMHDQALQDIEAQLKKLMEAECHYSYFEDVLYSRYSDQKKTMNIVLIFTIIAIIISTLGLIAISTYYTRQRYVEVGVRKVFGSSNWEIFSRLVGNFLKLLIISFVIAVPLAWYLIDYWLKDYTYRIDISPLIFIAAGFIALLIAVIAISWQSAKAANVIPVDSLQKQ